MFFFSEKKNCFVYKIAEEIVHFGGIFYLRKIFRELTDPDPDLDLSLPGPGSNFSDPWQLY